MASLRNPNKRLVKLHVPLERQIRSLMALYDISVSDFSKMSKKSISTVAYKLRTDTFKWTDLKLICKKFHLRVMVAGKIGTTGFQYRDDLCSFSQILNEVLKRYEDHNIHVNRTAMAMACGMDYQGLSRRKRLESWTMIEALDIANYLGLHIYLVDGLHHDFRFGFCAYGDYAEHGGAPIEYEKLREPNDPKWDSTHYLEVEPVR